MNTAAQTETELPGQVSREEPLFSAHWDWRGGLVVSKQTRQQIYLTVPPDLTQRMIYCNSGLDCDVLTSYVNVDIVMYLDGVEVGRLPAQSTTGNGFGTRAYIGTASRAQFGPRVQSYYTGATTLPYGYTQCGINFISVATPSQILTIPTVEGGVPIELEGTIFGIEPHSISGRMDTIALDIWPVGPVGYVYGWVNLGCKSSLANEQYN